MNALDHIESEQFDSLLSAAGAAVAKEILAAFSRSTEMLFGEVSDHLAKADYDEAAKSAHALKGSAANVGAKRLAQTALKIEEACRANSLADAQAALAAARDDFSTVWILFEEKLGAAE
ncbi:MAG: Hpt domain-containing protein [Pseudomonadota bacterium]